MQHNIQVLYHSVILKKCTIYIVNFRSSFTHSPTQYIYIYIYIFHICTNTHSHANLSSVSWIQIDSPIQQRAVHIGHHATHIASAVRRLVVSKAVDCALHVRVPCVVVAVVDGEDLLGVSWDVHVLSR